MPSMDYAQARKESVSSKICQRELSTIKYKEKIEGKKKKQKGTSKELWDSFKRCNLCVPGIPEEKREWDRRHI